MTGAAGGHSVGSRAAVRWALMGIAGAALAFVAPPARAAAPPANAAAVRSSPPTTPPSTSPTTPPSTPPTTSPPSTTPPTTAPPSSYSVAFDPCGSTAGGPCTQEPAQVQVSYGPATPAAVQIDWESTGRPTSAPAPKATSAALLWSDGTACGSGLRCWPWPATVTDSSFILNGTYQAAVCDTYTQNACQSSSAPVAIGVAVPPGEPTHVSAKASGAQVTVTWQPPAAVPPDLVGYTVSRAGRAVYSCSTDGLGPAAATPCPTSLKSTDRPGPGTFAYTVSALRLGSAADGHGVVSSAAASAGGPVAVSGYLTPPGSGGGGSAPAAFRPSPVIGGESTVIGTFPTTPFGATATLGPGDQGGNASAGGPPQNLQYPADNPVVGKPTMAVEIQAPPHHVTNVLPAGMLGLALLALAIAAHFLYLRVEVARIQARLAEAGSGPS